MIENQESGFRMTTFIHLVRNRYFPLRAVQNGLCNADRNLWTKRNQEDGSRGSDGGVYMVPVGTKENNQHFISHCVLDFFAVKRIPGRVT